MASLLARFKLDDYDAWKQGTFDRDPAGRREAAKGHRIMRNVGDPNDIFIAVDFDSADSARAFHERLMSSGALEAVTVVTEPTVVEEVDSETY